MTNPESMVERVAKAIFALNFHRDDDGFPLVTRWEDWPQDRRRAIEAARAAIEALKTPTEAMIEAAHHRLAADQGDVGDVYTAMIDTALSEPIERAAGASG